VKPNHTARAGRQTMSTAGTMATAPNHGTNLLFWLAQLCPRRKAVQNTALQKEAARYSRAKGKHAGQPQPYASSQCIEASFSAVETCAKHNKRGLIMLQHGWQRWRCGLWQLHANGVGNPGAQFDVPSVGRYIACMSVEGACINRMIGSDSVQA
jgi:hypothetical protein